MASQNPSDQKTFRNTFASDVKNGELCVHAMMMRLKTTALDFKDLPLGCRVPLRPSSRG